MCIRDRLEVYRLKEKLLIRDAGSALPDLADTTFLDNLNPVSYTHLDVYKRQAPHPAATGQVDVVGGFKVIAAVILAQFGAETDRRYAVAGVVLAPQMCIRDRPHRYPCAYVRPEHSREQYSERRQTALLQNYMRENRLPE